MSARSNVNNVSQYAESKGPYVGSDVSSSTADPCELVRRARQGSDSALGQLLNSYCTYLHQTAESRVRSGVRPKVSASDIVQNSLLVATRDFYQFQGDSERELRAWLTAIVNHQIVDGLRRFAVAEKRHANRELKTGNDAIHQAVDHVESPSRLVSLREDSERLTQIIASLPAPLREVFFARYIEGLTYQEAAKRLRLSVTTCRRRWLEAVTYLGSEFGTIDNS